MSSTSERISDCCERVIEVLALGLIILAPWPFASGPPVFELLLSVGVAAILILHAIRWTVAPDRMVSPNTPTKIVTACLFGLFLVSSLQLVPLPGGVRKYVSPGVDRWVTELVPEQTESPKGLVGSTVGAGDLNLQTKWGAGNRLSLNPHGSYRFSLRILAVATLFLAMSSFGNPKNTLRRLGFVAAIGGGAVAAFSIMQYLGSPPNRAYWYFETTGGGFGPFVNRNHYPFFANLAMGLVVGLFLDRREKFGLRWFDFVQDAVSLWCMVAIAVIGTSIFLCLSRGGVLSLAVAICVAVGVRLQRGRTATTVIAFLATVASVAAILVWIGFDLMESRLAQLLEADRYRTDGRWYLWNTATQVIQQFPMFGSGGETYRHWETILSPQEGDWNSTSLMAMRADNEFLDIGAEYGLFAVAFLILAAVTVFVHGFRIGRDNALATGALMSTTAIIVHSCMDFGLRMPATCFFSVVVIALLCSQNEKLRGRLVSRGSAKLDWLDRLSCAMAAGAVVFFAVVWVRENRRFERAETLRLASYRAFQQRDYPQFASLGKQSVALTPEDCLGRISFARVLLRASKEFSEPSEKENWIGLAMHECVQARGLCPLAWEPPLWIGQNHEYLNTTQDRLTYFKNASQLHPSDPSIAFAFGGALYESGKFEQVWPNWNRSLRYSAQFLESILTHSRKHLTPKQLVEQVVPRNANLLNAASSVAEKKGLLEEKTTFLQAAVEVLRESNRPTEFRDLAPSAALSGELLRKLGQIREAVAAYRTAVLYAPENSKWRVELIELLIETDALEDAKRETRTLLDLAPDHPAGNKLRERIVYLQTKAKANQK